MQTQQTSNTAKQEAQISAQTLACWNHSKI